jgi:gliding motility-associated-like protein
LTAATDFFSTINWSPAALFGTGNSTSYTINPDSSTLVSVTVRTNTCATTDSAFVVVNPSPSADFDYSFPGGCQGVEVAFQDVSTGAGSYLWEFGDGTVSNEANPTHVYQQAGSYDVTLTVSQPEDCNSSSTTTETIDVGGQLNAAFTSKPPSDSIISLPNAKVKFFNQNQGLNSYLWTFGDGVSSTKPNPMHSYQQPGSYTVQLVVTDEAGCVYTSEQKVYVVEDLNITLPNVFTPNNDNVNDRWSPGYSGDQSGTVHIYGRNGNLVYSANSLNEEWDGTNSAGNDVPPGTYFYTVQVGQRIFKGHITLVR